MKTTIRQGQNTFFGDRTFANGLSRSGHFNKRESDELALYGKTFEDLHNGKLLPINEDEIEFVAAMQTLDESSIYAARLWKKYLNAVEKSRVHHGFSMSHGKTRTPSGNELSFA